MGSVIVRLKDMLPILFLLTAFPVHQATGQEFVGEKAGDPSTNNTSQDLPPYEFTPDDFTPDQLPLVEPMADESDTRLLSPWLKTDNGFTATPVYYGEVFTNAHGGIGTRNSTQYEGLLDLSLDFDFEKMQLPIPGRINLLFQNTHGRGLEQNVGATQIISSIDSLNNITQISELWWEFGLFENRITMRLGKQDLSSEFVTMDSASDFINSAFGLSPSAGLPSFPSPSPAAILLTDLSPSLSFKVGVWDAYHSEEDDVFSRNDSALFIGELEYRYSTRGSQLPGIITLGMAYESPGVVPTGTIPRAFGYYFQFEQLLFREANSTENAPQGLSVFAQHFPIDSTGNSPFPVIVKDILAGFTYKGLIRGRDEDITGAGIGWVELNDGGTGEEFMVELFYKAKINSTLTIQPDLQYINSPSGIFPDALVAGIRFQLDL
tara:strand:- start:7277 stop:8581 length:1305 start_codon:yes stop_codon:yes gene_type:complete